MTAHYPSSSSCLSNSSLLTRYAVSGLRFITSYSNLSFSARYSFMSKVCVSNMECVPCTMGLITLLSVPSTMVGKNMMASQMANGRSSGNTSIGSALDSDCQTLRATLNSAPSPASPLAMSVMSEHNGIISSYRERSIW